MNIQEIKNLIKQHPNQFYTYLLKNPNGEPFYIGKASYKNPRIGQHLKEVLFEKCQNYYKGSAIRKIIENKEQVDYEIILFTFSEKLAFDKEIELINFYGRRNNNTGILANLTDGGDGISGWSHSKETIQKMSKTQMGKPRSEEHKQSMRKPKGPMSKKHKQQIGKSNKESQTHTHEERSDYIKKGWETRRRNAYQKI